MRSSEKSASVTVVPPARDGPSLILRMAASPTPMPLWPFALYGKKVRTACTQQPLYTSDWSTISLRSLSTIFGGLSGLALAFR